MFVYREEEGEEKQDEEVVEEEEVAQKEKGLTMLLVAIISTWGMETVFKSQKELFKANTTEVMTVFKVNMLEDESLKSQ